MNFKYYLKSHQQSDSFHRIIASVHIVPHEQVICVWRLPSNSEELHEVVELAMDVPTHGDGASHLLDIGLLSQDLFSLRGDWSGEQLIKTWELNTPPHFSFRTSALPESESLSPFQEWADGSRVTLWKSTEPLRLVSQTLCVPWSTSYRRGHTRDTTLTAICQVTGECIKLTYYWEAPKSYISSSPSAKQTHREGDRYVWALSEWTAPQECYPNRWWSR